MTRRRYAVSACLAGIACRYDGRDNARPEVVSLVRQGRAIPVCPESLGNLGIPRPPCEMYCGRVLTQEGEDRTDAFVQGAESALRIACAFGCDAAILKARSPSCGRGAVYDGSFTRTLTQGDGVFASMLLQRGIPVFTEEEPDSL